MENSLREIHNLSEDTSINYKKLYEVFDLLEKVIKNISTDEKPVVLTRAIVYVRCSLCIQEDGHWSNIPWICDNCNGPTHGNQKLSKKFEETFF